MSSLIDDTLKSSAAVPRSLRRAQAAQLTADLELLCHELGPGGKVPSHRELMVRYSASERAILAALADLQHRHLVARKYGSGTYVSSQIFELETASGAGPTKNSLKRTLTAILRPDHGFFDRVMGVLYQEAAAQGFQLICQPVEFDHDLSSTLDFFTDADAYILFGRHLAPLAEALAARGSRTVLNATLPAGAAVRAPVICGDSIHGGYLAANHLIGLGHRRIAFTFGWVNGHNPRFQGALRAVVEARQAGIMVEIEELSFEREEEWIAKPSSLADYFGTEQAPTGIIAWNDNVAALIVSLATTSGLSVPGDLSVVGFDASREGAIYNPPITTVDFHVRQQMWHALDFLTREQAVEAATTSYIEPSLIIRGSTAAPNQAATTDPS